MPRIIQINNGWRKYRVNTKLKVNPKDLPARWVCNKCLSVKHYRVSREAEYFTVPICCNIPMLLAGEPKYLKGVGYIDPVDNLARRHFICYPK